MKAHVLYPFLHEATSSSVISRRSFCSWVTTFDGRSTHPGFVSACVTYTLNGLKVMNTLWSSTIAELPYCAHSLGLGALRSIASLEARSFGLVLIAESIVIPRPIPATNMPATMARLMTCHLLLPLKTTGRARFPPPPHDPLSSGASESSSPSAGEREKRFSSLRASRSSVSSSSGSSSSLRRWSLTRLEPWVVRCSTPLSC
mmetsp:Transcript_22266/g.49570  ORF Transcript_22266/g.49570 Transcript_22266/m.49570 type:complete len:202 (-) Transcript_22266:221-826(-)